MGGWPGSGLGTGLGSPAASWAHASLGTPRAAHIPCALLGGAPSRKHHHPADGQAEGPGAPTCAASPSPLPLPSSASLPPPSLLQTYLAPAATSFLSLQVTPLQAHSFQALPDPPGPSSWIGPSGRGGSGARSRCPLGALQDLPARVRPAGSNL